VEEVHFIAAFELRVDFSGCGVALLDVDVADDDGRAVGRPFAYEAGTEAACASGDENDFVFDVVGVVGLREVEFG